MKGEAALVVPNNLAALESLTRFISEFCSANGIPEELEPELNLVLEEVVVNVIMHGYGDQAQHDIHVGLSMKDDWISLTVEDDGVPFNPLEAPEADVHASLESRGIGGLGLHLVLNIMQELQYTRDGKRNRLVMRKRIG